MTRHLNYWLRKNNITYDVTSNLGGFYIRPKDEDKVVEYVTKLGLFNSKETCNGLILIILNDCSIWELLRKKKVTKKKSKFSL